MDKAEMYRKGMSREEAYKRLFERIGDSGEVMILRDTNDGEEALLSKRSVRKLLSGAASGKSAANGFTHAQHFAVAADIEDVFANSVKVLERPDRDGNQDITIHRFAAPLHFGDAAALMTVKEAKRHGKKMYSIELVKIKELRGTLAETREASRVQPRPELDTEGRSTTTHAGNPPHETQPQRLYANNIRKLHD